jgi:hypothetical protein
MLKVKWTPTQLAITRETHDLCRMLIAKNRKYGDSALNPLRIFSKADPVEAIKVRIDDKLSRLERCPEGTDDEDTIMDLIGYLVLLRIARKQRDNQRGATGSTGSEREGVGASEKVVP